MTLQFRVNSWIDSLVKRKMIQRNHTNNLLGVLESLAGLLKNWTGTETRRLMKFKGRSSLLAFLINADLPFLCDSASLWPISPFHQPAKTPLHQPKVHRSPGRARRANADRRPVAPGDGS